MRAKSCYPRGIQWDRFKISVFPDMAKDVAERRLQLNKVRKKLHELDCVLHAGIPSRTSLHMEGGEGELC